MTTPTTQTTLACENCGASAHEGDICIFCHWLEDSSNKAALGQLLRATYAHATGGQTVEAAEDMTNDSVFEGYYDEEAENLTRARWQHMTDEQYEAACEASDEEAGLRYDAQHPGQEF